MEPDNNQKSRLTSQIQSFRSGNRTAILVTLKELRSLGSVEILPELFDLLVTQEDEQIIAETCSLLNDLKDQDAVASLVSAIESPEYEKILPFLVGACWQNGLSYGNHVETFLEVALTGEYPAAIEAFTVIEEAIGEVDEIRREKLVKKIKSRIQDADDQKKSLLSELVKVISHY